MVDTKESEKNETIKKQEVKKENCQKENGYVAAVSKKDQEAIKKIKMKEIGEEKRKLERKSEIEREEERNELRKVMIKIAGRGKTENDNLEKLKRADKSDSKVNRLRMRFEKGGRDSSTEREKEERKKVNKVKGMVMEFSKQTRQEKRDQTAKSVKNSGGGGGGDKSFESKTPGGTDGGQAKGGFRKWETLTCKEGNSEKLKFINVATNFSMFRPAVIDSTGRGENARPPETNCAIVLPSTRRPNVAGVCVWEKRSAPETN